MPLPCVLYVRTKVSLLTILQIRFTPVRVFRAGTFLIFAFAFKDA